MKANLPEVIVIEIMLKFRCFIFLLPVVLGVVACGRTAAIALPPVTPTLNAQASAGKVVFTRECAACHSLLADTIIVGPSMKGIAGQAGARVADQDARAYLLSSIIDPGGYVLEGYQNLMPTNFGTRLTGEEIDALVAFMLTLE